MSDRQVVQVTINQKIGTRSDRNDIPENSSTYKQSIIPMIRNQKCQMLKRKRLLVCIVHCRRRFLRQSTTTRIQRNTTKNIKKYTKRFFAVASVVGSPELTRKGTHQGAGCSVTAIPLHSRYPYRFQHEDFGQTSSQGCCWEAQKFTMISPWKSNRSKVDLCIDHDSSWSEHNSNIGAIWIRLAMEVLSSQDIIVPLDKFAPLEKVLQSGRMFSSLFRIPFKKRKRKKEHNERLENETEHWKPMKRS